MASRNGKRKFDKRKFTKRQDDERDTRRQSRDEGERDSAYKHTPFNDLSWYNANPDLLAAAGSLPFPYRPGMTIPIAVEMQIGEAGAITTTPLSMTVPGILAIQWIPTVGVSNSPNSPISIAAREVYSKVRSQFSGSLEADAPDFVIYLMALDSIFSYIANLKRIYRLINAYSPNNYFTPRGILTAMGFSEEDIVELQRSKMDFFGVINQLIGMTDKFICPAVFPVFNRHYWLNDNVYMDSASINAQFYIFLQESYYRFALQPVGDGAGIKAGGLVPEVFDPSNTTTGVVEYLYNFGKKLIDDLSASDDAYTISGYLMRAYQDATKFVVDRLGIDEKFDALYEPSVLAQIENAACIGYYTDAIDNVVTQDPATNSIICENTAHVDIKSNPLPIHNALPMLSLRSDAPTAADVVEASRLSSYLDWSSITKVTPGTVESVPIVSGTEIVTTFNVTLAAGNGQTYYTEVLQTATASGLKAFQAASRLSAFDWAPRVMLCAQGANRMMWDVHNVTSFSVRQMADINRVCLFSEFNSFTKI